MQSRDEILWSIAKKRAAFKKQLITYIIINSFLWAIWFSSGHEFTGFNHFPWPVWVMFWWGIGLAFSFTRAYVVDTKNDIEQEYQKLKNQQ